MILRRISGAIRRQDWVTVTIEFVLVIAGVLIALQANNWNEARKDRALEQIYLERLFADLNGTIEHYNGRLEWNKETFLYQHQALQSLRAGVLDDAHTDNFEATLARLGTINPLNRRWGTVEELVSTGNITLISDVELRSGIAAINSSYERAETIIQKYGSLNNIKQNELTRHFYIVRDDVGKVIANYDFGGLAENAEFINNFSTLQDSCFIIIYMGYLAMIDFERFRDQLAEHLGVDTSNLPKLIELPKPWSELVAEEARQ